MRNAHYSPRLEVLNSDQQAQVEMSALLERGRLLCILDSFRLHCIRFFVIRFNKHLMTIYHVSSTIPDNADKIDVKNTPCLCEAYNLLLSEAGPPGVFFFIWKSQIWWNIIFFSRNGSRILQSLRIEANVYIETKILWLVFFQKVDNFKNNHFIYVHTHIQKASELLNYSPMVCTKYGLILC